MLTFTVDGIPAPQGSKTPWGSEANPRTRPWRESIASVAARAMNGRDPIAGPVDLILRFTFPRPKSHYGTGKNATNLKPSAPHHVTKKPDLDKLVRAVCDGITGIVFRDDAQVAAVAADKVFGSPGVMVKAREIRAGLLAPVDGSDGETEA